MPRIRFAMNTLGFPQRYVAWACLLAVGAAAYVPLLAGCGHESAASPVSRPVAMPDVSDVTHATSADAPEGTTAEEPAGTSESSHATTAGTEPPLSAEAPSKAPPVGQRPPADRGPTRPGDAEKITWDDLNLGMQADVVFRPFMADPVKHLEGKRISIIGYMHGGQAGQRGIKEFILLKNTQCKFGPGGQADHLAD